MRRKIGNLSRYQFKNEFRENLLTWSSRYRQKIGIFGVTGLVTNPQVRITDVMSERNIDVVQINTICQYDVLKADNLGKKNQVRTYSTPQYPVVVDKFVRDSYGPVTLVRDETGSRFVRDTTFTQAPDTVAGRTTMALDNHAKVVGLDQDHEEDAFLSGETHQPGKAYPRKYAPVSDYRYEGHYKPYEPLGTRFSDKPPENRDIIGPSDKKVIEGGNSLQLEKLPDTRLEGFGKIPKVDRPVKRYFFLANAVISARTLEKVKKWLISLNIPFEIRHKIYFYVFPTQGIHFFEKVDPYEETSNFKLEVMRKPAYWNKLTNAPHTVESALEEARSSSRDGTMSIYPGYGVIPVEPEDEICICYRIPCRCCNEATYDLRLIENQ